MADYCNIDTGKCFKEGKWIPLSEVGGKLETGDLVETPTRFPENYPIVGGVVVPIINHYGIYLEIDGKPMVAHNPFGGKPEIIPLEQFEGVNRKIERIIRTGMTAEHIIKKTEECKHKSYEFLGNNCEMFINYVCGCPVGYDQRIGWGLFIIAVILIFLAVKPKSI